MLIQKHELFSFYVCHCYLIIEITFIIINYLSEMRGALGVLLHGDGGLQRLYGLHPMYGLPGGTEKTGLFGSCVREEILPAASAI
ncbi:hypothetical protein QJS04_geneDACA021395 [Acorus gramineus]|uniref:Uncharacterized protein n=1 Tax=Acorus gramineus TaxID=55184 RepID=A0AAV9A5E8_ACOGR|nr:hypothetical protein QJS04_geneDACA021395 [Acorus gramineus]